jgi:hypothetical protein
MAAGEPESGVGGRMTDREKIVRGLENTRKLLSSFVFPFSDDADAVIADTISLLKEQEAEKKCCRDCEYYGACHDK